MNDQDWREKYWDLMTAENFEEAIPLKQFHFPKSFFKYRNLSERTLETLHNSYLWLAEISSLNDPFECSIQFDNDECLRAFYASEDFRNNFRHWTGEKLNDQEIRRLTTSKNPHAEYLAVFREKGMEIKVTGDEQLKKIQKRWNEIVKEQNQNLRICSFSITKNSLLLWSHYSQEHKGIAIEYNFLETDHIRTFIQPVIYRNRVHKIGLFEEYTTMNMIASSLIKSEDWKYEQEWRLTIFKQADEFPNKVNAPTPIAIYLGTRFDENKKELKDKLFLYAEQNNIPIKRMIKHPNKFELIENTSANKR